jgi:hypothetical protein
VIKKNDIERDMPGMTRRKFLYNLSHASYDKEWTHNHQEPGFGTKFLAFIIRVIPKIGPLKALSFHTPTPEAEKLFMDSFNASLDDYRRLLADDGQRLDEPEDDRVLASPRQGRTEEISRRHKRRRRGDERLGGGGGGKREKRREQVQSTP